MKVVKFNFGLVLFLFISFYSFAQTGTQYANVQFIDRMEKGEGSYSIYVYVENEYDGHWDYLKDLDIDVSVDGGSYKPFAFLGKQDGVYGPNSYETTYLNRGTEYVLNTGSGYDNQHIRLYFKNDDAEVESGAVSFSHFEDTNSQVNGTPNGADRIHINIQPYLIDRFKGAKTIQFRTRGNYLENWLDHQNSNNVLEVGEKYTGEIQLFEEDNSGQDEIDFNVDFSKSEGAAHLTFRIESVTNETEYDHLACLELKKIVKDPNGNVVSDEIVGFVNHNSLGCSDLFSDASSSATFEGAYGDSYKFGLKHSNLMATKYNDTYYTTSGGDNYFVIRDYISQKNYSNSIEYYVHGTYYSRDRDGQNKSVNFNWSDNIKGNFVVGNEISIPSIQLTQAEVSTSQNCQIDLGWSAPTTFGDDATRNVVAVYRDDILIAELDAHDGIDSYKDTAVSPGVNYSYKIALEYSRSFNEDKFENLKGQKAGGESVRIDLLEAPSGLSTTQVGCNGNIEISWNYVSNPANFILQRKGEGEDAIFQTIEGEIEGSLRSFTDVSVEENKVYVYRIAAISSELSCGAIGVYSASYTHSKDPIDITPIFNNNEFLVESSKGYFSNRTELEWTPNLDTEQYINQYKIYSREFGSTVKPGLLTTLGINSKKYEHVNGKAGRIYEYFIVGERVVETECGRQITSSYAISGLSGASTPLNLGNGVAYNVGLRVATGVINGNITFSGGTSVPDVKVIAERQEGNQGKSLSFNGVDSYAEVPVSDSFNFKEDFTASFWVKPETDVETYLMETNQFKVLRLKNGQLVFAVYGKEGGFTQLVTDWHVVPKGNWTQVTMTYNNTKQEIKAYYNGKLWGKLALDTGFSSLRDIGNGILSIGRREGDTGYYLGKMDEIRLYNRCLEEEEVRRVSGSFIAADYDGLVLYLKVFEGQGNKIYDISHEGDVFYKNDGMLSNALFSSDIPTSAQLGNAGYTDIYGNYTIEAVEYGNSGENFNIIPTATLAGAVHEFDPARKTLFIGEGSRVNNDKDFEDISSFQFSGFVRYNFGNKDSGSEEITMYLDGLNAIAGENNQVYQTNEDGFFDVQIPIGHHFIEFRRNGHVFENGRFPEEGTYDFQAGITGLQIWDNTLHVFSGRIVGGVVEGDKPLSMSENPSVNNIGQAKLTLTSQDGKIINDIVSDSETGEFRVELPPKKYISSSVKWIKDLVDIIPSSDIQTIDLGSILAYNGASDVDSVFVEEIFDRVDSTFYNVRKDFIYRTQPELVVTDTIGNAIEFTGESFYQFNEGDAVKDVKLSDLPFPTYFSAKDYAFKMVAVEKYQNKDTSIEHVVPVSDGQLVINNSIGTGYKLNENNQKEKYGSPEVVGLDQNGQLVYLFKASDPNINENSSVGKEHLSYTKQLSITLTIGNKSTSWPNPSDSNETFRAYVLGGAAIGNNFVTKAPAVVDYILRDPAGSNSYSYWEKDATKSTTQEFYVGGFVNIDAHIGAGVGTNTLVGGGIVGVGEISETHLTATMDISASVEIGGGGEYSTEETFSQRIETNGTPSQIGRSDVFVAKSQNIQTGIGVHIRPVPIDQCGGNCYGDTMMDSDGKSYRMTRVLQTYTNPVGTPTYFIFSQNHIENVLIPDLIEIRNSLFTNPGSKYSSHLPVTHSLYASNNDDIAWGVNATSVNHIRTEKEDLSGLSYTYNNGGNDKAVDSVRTMNQQIRLWKEALADNEIEKWMANTYANADNISISGGSLIEKSKTYTSSSYSYKSIEASASIAVGLDTSFEGYGVDIDLVQNNEIGMRSSAKFGNGQENTVTTGYVLSDEDEDDALSINVFDGVGNGGVIFSTVGGQTSCPFEDKITMKFTSVDYVDRQIVNREKDIARLERKIASIESSIVEANKEDNLIATISLTSEKSRVLEEKQSIVEALGKYKVLKTELVSGEVILSNATLQRDKPALEINGAKTAQAFNVPADEAASFELTLINKGEAGDPQYFSVKSIDETNPNGLEMTIDGQSINTDREFLVQGNGGIQKVLKVKRGPNHYNYENVGVVIKSTCQADPTSNDAVLADTIYFDAKFLPTCTPIQINWPNNNWTINNSFDNKFPITIGGYDVNTVGFDEVKLQYKEASSSEWTLLSTYYRNEVLRDSLGAIEDPILPTNGNSFTFDWNLGKIPDGSYDIRAISKCSLAEESTQIFSGIIDRKDPEPFGAPQPSDGILSAGEEASIQFTESINSNLLSVANFDVRGVLNEGEIRHDASVSFDGSENNYVKIEHVNLDNKAFTIEFYAKRTGSNKDQVLIAQGSDALTEMLIGINPSNRVYFKLAGKLVTGSKVIDTNWHHYAVTYDPQKSDVVLYIDAEQDEVDNSFVVMNKLKEDLYFGKSIIGTGSPFEGQMHEVRIWSEAISIGAINIAAVKRMVGNEAGLLHNWEMEEIYGELAIDKVRGKNAMMAANWTVDPVGYALRLNGTKNQAITQSVALDNKTDFTIEMWFKSDGGSSETLLSNGKGDGTDENTSGWVLGINSSGKIQAISNGNELEGTTNVLDNKWHHMALVVNTRGNATLLLDGQEEVDISSSLFNGFGGSRLAIGQRDWFVTTTNMSDQFFKGSIDEIRIWNTARTVEQITRDRFNNLSGNEPGLLEYYPFETYQEDAFGVVQLSESLDNKSESNAKSTQNVSLVNSAVNQVTPTIKLKRPVENVNISYVVNNDKIIISLNAEPKKIENVALDFTISNVKDNNGNIISSPITWTAYVDKNQVVWQDSQFNLQTENGTELKFETHIFNNSGESKTYQISNIPSWLEPSHTHGTIGPLTSVPVSFIVSGDTNNGTYQQDVLLTTDFGYAEKLNVNVGVKQAPPTNWNINPMNFEYSMNVIGQISFDGILSRDSGNILAAFVGGECRGMVNLTHLSTFDNYQAFLTVYSNSAIGEVLEFKVWEAATGVVHSGITHNLSNDNFIGDAFEGTSVNPKLFNTTNVIAGEIAVSSGWKWISFNLEGSDLNTTNGLLQNLNPADNDIVKTRINKSNGSGGFVQTAIFDKYAASANTWYGSLTNNGSFDTGVLYKIKVSNPGVIRYEGSPVNLINHEINLVNGWNYIGYTGMQKIELNEGLNNLEATSGDLIKNQYYSAIYDENYGWIGSLRVLSPSEGYMLYTANSQSFHYPAFNSSTGSKQFSKDLEEKEELFWNVNGEGYAENMTLVAEVLDANNATGELAAFVRGECVGTSKALYNPILDQNVFVLTMGGNLEMEEVSFKFKNEDSDQQFSVLEKVVFKENQVIGSLYKPTELNILDELNIRPVIGVYPNPFIEKVTVQVNIKQSTEVKISMYDANSRLLKVKMYNDLDIGQQELEFVNDDFSAGVYYLRIEVEGKVFTEKVAIKATR